MSFKEKSLIELTDFIKKEIPFDSMKKNNGVYETSSLGKSLSEIISPLEYLTRTMKITVL